jgi:hypothetical protein
VLRSDLSSLVVLGSVRERVAAVFAGSGFMLPIEATFRRIFCSILKKGTSSY